MRRCKVTNSKVGNSIIRELQKILKEDKASEVWFRKNIREMMGVVLLSIVLIKNTCKDEISIVL